MQKQNGGRPSRYARIETLDKRVLLAATGTVDFIASNFSDNGVGYTDQIVGPGGRYLQITEETRYNKPALVKFSNQANVVLATFGGDRESYKPGFHAFDASGRAIVVMQHDYEIATSPATQASETLVFSFPADGSAPTTVAGLSADALVAYDGADAMSPDGSVLDIATSGTTLELRRVKDNVVTKKAVARVLPSSAYTIRGVATNNAGDVVLMIDQGVQSPLRIVRISNAGLVDSIQVPAQGFPTNASPLIDVAIDSTAGAVQVGGRVWKFALSGALNPNAYSDFTTAQMDSVSLVARGNGEFEASILDFPRTNGRFAFVQTFDTQRGLVGIGDLLLPTAGTDLNFLHSPSLQSTPGGSFGFIYQQYAQSDGPEYSQVSYAALGTLDTMPQTTNAELGRQLVTSTGGFNQPGYRFGYRLGTTTKWGATPSTGDGITSSESGGFAILNSGPISAVGFTTSYYLSLDSQLSSQDIPLRTDVNSLAPFSTLDIDGSRSTQVYLPSTIPAGFAATGNYYLIAKIDATNVAPERDETDNVIAFPFRVDGIETQPGKASGKVLDSNGAPVANARVYDDANYNNKFDAGELVSLTNSAGEYALNFATVGSKHIAIDAATFTPASGWWFKINYPGESYTFNFTVPSTTTPPPPTTAGNRASGKVSNTSGAAVANVRVYLDANFNNRFDAGETSATSDASGNYILDFGGTGNMHVMVDAASPNPASGYWYGIGVVGDKRTLNFTVAGTSTNPPPPTTGNRASGKVSNASGAGLANVRVYLDANFNSRYDAGEASAMSGASGDYVLDFGGTGSVHVMVEGENPSPASGYWYSIGAVGDQRTMNFTVAGTSTNPPPPTTTTNRASGKVTRGGSTTAVANARVYVDANFNGRYDAGETSAFSSSTGDYVLDFGGTGSFHVSVDAVSFTPAGGYWYGVGAVGDKRTLNFVLA